MPRLSREQEKAIFAKRGKLSKKARRRLVVGALAITGVVGYNALIRKGRSHIFHKGFKGSGTLGGVHSFKQYEKYIRGQYRGTPKNVSASMRRLARVAGVPASDVRGLRKFTSKPVPGTHPTRGPVGIFAQNKVGENFDLLLGKLPQIRVRRNPIFPGPITKGIQKTFFAGPTTRPQFLKHEIGHHVWARLPLATRLRLGPQLRRTRAANQFMWGRRRYYVPHQEATEAFAEVFRKHRNVPSKQTRFRRGSKQERRLLAQALADLRRNRKA
jgi:hypothetical protein